MTWTLIDGRGILEVLVENFVFCGGVAGGATRRGRSVVMEVDFGGDGARIRRSVVICGARPGEGEGCGDRAVSGFLSWIHAVAEEDDGARRERNPKRLGELSQAAFLVKAQAMGFGLALPWGDSEKYDFVVWARPGGRLLRVQVKATGRLNGGGYDVQPVYSTRGEGKKIYTERDIDVLAAHVVRGETEDVWYLLPVRAFAGVKSLRLFPDLKSRNPRWEGYREKWRWLGMKRL
jgi:PD-(D/E)XK endonuclease